MEPGYCQMFAHTSHACNAEAWYLRLDSRGEAHYVCELHKGDDAVDTRSRPAMTPHREGAGGRKP